MVRLLQTRLGGTKVEVVRRGLKLLKGETDLAGLRAAYREASVATRVSHATEIDELDHLVAEGLDGL